MIIFFNENWLNETNEVKDTPFALKKFKKKKKKEGERKRNHLKSTNSITLSKKKKKNQFKKIYAPSGGSVVKNLFAMLETRI